MSSEQFQYAAKSAEMVLNTGIDLRGMANDDKYYELVN